MRFLFSSLVVVSALAATAPAFGQALSAQDEAQQRFQTGLKYYDQRDFESARLAFTQAYAVTPKPSILQNLACSELYSTNHVLEAVIHFDQFLHDPSVPDAQKGRAKRSMEEAMKKTGHYAVKLTPESCLTVDGKPPSAMPPSLVHVMPGAHVLEAKLAGRTRSMSPDAKAGETTNVDLTLDGTTPAIAPVPPPVTPPPPPVVEPPHEHAPSFWTTRHTVGVITGGLAVIGAAVGAGFLIARNGHVSDGKDLIATTPAPCASPSSATCGKYQDARDGIRSSETAATVSFIAAGALGVTAVVLLLWPDSKREASQRFLPVGRDLSVVGTF